MSGMQMRYIEALEREFARYQEFMLEEERKLEVEMQLSKREFEAERQGTLGISEGRDLPGSDMHRVELPETVVGQTVPQEPFHEEPRCRL